MLKGRQTQSPFLMRRTALPLDDPEVLVADHLPGSSSVRPSYMWKYDPQILVLVMRTRNRR